jgi:hypothetical protein
MKAPDRWVCWSLDPIISPEMVFGGVRGFVGTEMEVREIAEVGASAYPTASFHIGYLVPVRTVRGSVDWRPFKEPEEVEGDD